MRAARAEAANGRPERLWNVPEAECAPIQRKESHMDRRALGSAAPMRTFAALAALMAAGLTLPASQPRPAPARPVPAWSRPVPRPGPAAFRPARPPAAGMVIRLAGPPGRAPARPPSRMHTLTIKGFSLAGTPDTGDLVQLFNVDDT